MIEKELKKLNRAELLEMLIDQTKRADELQEKLEKAEAELKSRRIEVEEAGSIAEASLRLNGVFESTQAACEQYLENIRLLKDKQEEICAKREKESKEQAESMLAETERSCDEMRQKAKLEAEGYWAEVSERLENFYAEHAGLRELLSFVLPKQEQDE